MKRLVVYYSLSGNTEDAAKKIAEELDADLLKLETEKAMPKSFAARIIVGGGQVIRNYIPALKPIEIDVGAYDEIVLGSPIWNSKGVPAVNAFLQDKSAAEKVTALFFLSAGGDTRKGLAAITTKLPNLKHSVSLLDRKHKESKDNDAKIGQFVALICATENGETL